MSARLVNRSGRLMWKVGDRLFPYIGGGADDPVPDPAPDPTPDPTPDPEDLGEAGKKALAAERKRAKDAEKATKAAEKERDDLQTRFEKLDTDAKSEQEKAIDKAREEASTETRKQERERVNALLVKAEVKVSAAGKLADPEDAVRFLDLSEFSVSDDGEVDSEAVSKAIGELVENKPYLASNGTKPTGSADGGARPPGKPDVAPGMGRLRAAYAQSGNKT